MAQHCVLLIEPELPVRHPVAEYLRQCGYRVLEAVNTDEAMVLLAKKDDIDVVLANVGSPGATDAFALSQWVREKGHRAKVLLAGTHGKIAEHAGKLCDDGPKKNKPYHDQQLLEEIKRLIASHKRSNDEET